MDRETALKFAEENSDYEVIEDYSGRGMFGNTTHALRVPEMEDTGYVITKAKKEAEEEGRYDPELGWDNLGLDYIVY